MCYYRKKKTLKLCANINTTLSTHLFCHLVLGNCTHSQPVNLLNQFPSDQPTNQRQRWLPIRLPTKQNKQEGRKESKPKSLHSLFSEQASKRLESVCVFSQKHRQRQKKQNHCDNSSKVAGCCCCNNMSAESKQQNGQLDEAKTDNDQPSSLSSFSNVELIIKKPHSIWEYRPPLTVDMQLKPALKPYRSFDSGNQFSFSSSASASTTQPFQSADVTACQHQKSSMDSQKLPVTLRSERNFSVKESQVEAVKPLEKRTERTILPQATTANTTANQSVQSSFTGKQVEEGEKEEEMQSFIAPKVADHESLPSRPPSYRFSSFFSFFPQPSKEWHQQQLFSATAAVYNSLSQQPPPNSSSFSSSSSSPPPSPPPPYVITTTTFTQTPISSSSTPLKPAARSTSRLHHFIKYLLSGSNLYQKKKKSKTSKKLPKTAALSLEEDYQVTDRLEKVMKRVTLAATFLIFCAVLVLIARRCIAFNADDAGKLLLKTIKNDKIVIFKTCPSRQQTEPLSAANHCPLLWAT